MGLGFWSLHCIWSWKQSVIDCSYVLVWQREKSIEIKCSPIWRGHVPGKQHSGKMPRGKVTSHGGKTDSPRIDRKCLSFNGKLPFRSSGDSRQLPVYLATLTRTWDKCVHVGECTHAYSSSLASCPKLPTHLCFRGSVFFTHSIKCCVIRYRETNIDVFVLLYLPPHVSRTYRMAFVD